MDRSKWIAKKNLLCNLIKKISDKHGGDDVQWLREYCQQVLDEYPDDKIEQAILCFLDLEEQLKYVPCRTKES